MKTLTFLNNLRAIYLIIFFVLNILSMAFASNNHPQKNLNPVSSGQLNLYTQSKPDNESGIIVEKTNALLMSSTVDVSANAISTAVTFKQRFKNTSKDWVEGIYVFPLPKNAAVDKMEIIIEGKRIVGKIRKKRQAKELYEAAKNNGQRAALVEHVSDELFHAKVGNISPNSEIEIVIHYVQQTHYDNEQFSITIPTTYTPKYLITNDDNNLKKTINPEKKAEKPHLDKGINQFNSHTQSPFKVKVTLDTGAEIKTIQSASHKIKKQTINQQAVTITTNQDSVYMDRDFHLNWRIKEQAEPLTLSFTEQSNQQYFTSLLIVPPHIKQTYQHPREVVFIIDRSGSMSGQSILQAKKGALIALKHLNPQDTFNIIEFDDEYSILFNQSQLASKANLEKAESYINALQADGGTEMIQPLERALKLPKEAERLRQVVFLTDGAISDSSRLYQLIRNHLGDSRLFTVGIGFAPNAFVMKQIATLGKGTFQQINNINEVALTINNLFKKLKSPVLTDIKISLPSHLSPEILPTPIADLYAGQAISAHIKTSQPPRLEDFSIHGKYLGKDYLITPSIKTKTIEKQPITGMDKMWAKAKINHYELLNLMSEDYSRHNIDIEKLGLDYQLLTSQTAFIAIEEKIVRDAQKKPLKTKQVPNQMPYGNTMAFPQTSTSATLTMILALISLLSAIALVIFQKKLILINRANP